MQESVPPICPSSSEVNVSLDSSPTGGAPNLRIASAGSARTTGVTVVESAEPEVTARKLATESGAELVEGLGSAVKALSTAAAALEAAHAAARAKQAIALAKRLERFDEQADAALIARRSELEAAVALGPDANQQLVDLYRRLDLLPLSEREQARAEHALEEAAAPLPFHLLSDVDPVALRRARQELVAAHAECQLAEQELAEATAVTAALIEEQQTDDEGVAHAEAAARQTSEVIGQRSRSLLLQAAAVTGVVVVLIAVTAAGVLDPVIGFGLAAACVPPIIELLRRAMGARASGARRVEGAASLAYRAAQKRLSVLEAARDRQAESEQRVAEANRGRFAASARWQQVAGPHVREDQADDAIEVAADLARLRAAAVSAVANADRLRRGFAAELTGLGAAPELEPRDALRYLQHLVDLGPTAAELLELVAEAEQRAVQREKLAALVGRRDMAAVRRAARDRWTATLHPLVIIDDRDQANGPVVADALVELDDALSVMMVTQRPRRWRSLTSGSDDQPATAID